VTGSAWYFDDTEGLLRIGVGYRLMGSSTLGAYGKLDYVTDARSGEKLSCAGTPVGGCYRSFRPGRGGSVALGVRQMIASRLMVGAAAGIGPYGNVAVKDGIRPYVDGEVSLRALPHVAVMGLGRYYRWSSQGYSYWYAPLMVGLQIH
jgi:hypothetical protein